MQILHSLSKPELNEYMQKYGEPAYRIGQLFDFLADYKSFDEMTSLSKGLREKLAKDAICQPLSIHTKLTSKNTIKYIFKTSDNQLIESVMMTYKHGNTLCVSTQIGCKMGCAFCASGKNGFFRNLEAGEILAEVLLANRDNGGTAKKRAITNVVLMGSGEPLDNFDHTTKFLQLVTNQDGINISARNISLSTCGLPNKIRELAKLEMDITLTISLHATTDELRKSIMPIAQSVKLEELFSAVRDYFSVTGRRVCFEYILMKQNTTTEDATRLKFLTHGIMSHINLIPLNSVEESTLKPIPKADAYKFCELLKQKGMSATIRRTMGEDIEGACGQLKRRILNDTKVTK